MNEKLNQAIISCARRLQHFKINGKPIGIEYAHRAVGKWINNFSEIISKKDLLIELLNGIEFISDDSILRSTLSFIEKSYPDDGIYYTSFGDENESSARIVSQLNNNKNYKRDIFSLLKHLNEENIETAKIVFIDDFLNSGGQFSRIVQKWFTNSSKCNVDKNNHYLDLLKKCELIFVFAYGMEKGRLRAEKEITELKLNANVHIITQYDDSCGIFGSSANIANILQKAEMFSEQESAFKNYRCKDVNEIYKICLTAGEQLYRKNNPTHKEKKVKTRILGYGNSAKLFIGQNNIPTCTLTCLFLGGEVNYNDKIINWQPLFNRNKKITGGSESDKITLSLEEKLSRSYLDLTKGRETVLEISVAADLDDVFTEFSPDLWSDFSETSLDFMDCNLPYFLEINRLSYIYKLNPDFYKKINSRLKFYKNNDDKAPLNVKISDVLLITFGKLKSFLEIKIEFQDRKIDLKTALEVNSLIGLKQFRKNSAFFRIRTGRDESLDFNIYQLFESIRQNVNDISFLDYSHLQAIGTCEKVERYVQFSYLRENGDYFKSVVRQLNEFIKLASDFSAPKEKNLEIPDTFESIDLSLEATVSFSEKGMVFIGNNITKNLSIRQHFFYNHGFCYFLGWHLSLLISEYRLTSFRQTKRAGEIAEWLKRFDLFPFEKIGRQNYLNLYCDRLMKQLKIADNIKLIRRHKNEK